MMAKRIQNKKLFICFLFFLQCNVYARPPSNQRPRFTVPNSKEPIPDWPRRHLLLICLKPQVSFFAVRDRNRMNWHLALIGPVIQDLAGGSWRPRRPQLPPDRDGSKTREGKGLNLAALRSYPSILKRSHLVHVRTRKGASLCCRNSFSAPVLTRLPSTGGRSHPKLHKLFTLHWFLNPKTPSSHLPQWMEAQMDIVKNCQSVDGQICVKTPPFFVFIFLFNTPPHL